MATNNIVKLVMFRDYSIGVTTLDIKNAELYVLKHFGFSSFSDYLSNYPAGSEYYISRISTDDHSYMIADRYNANDKVSFMSFFNISGNAKMKHVINNLCKFKLLNNWCLQGPTIYETKLCSGFKSSKRKELYICSDWNEK